jgi:hypothetical protein
MLRTHNVRLSTNGYQSVDMLADGYQHLSSHVAALLCPRCLILNVDTGGALLDEQLCELHDSCEAAVSSVCVGNDRSQEIGIGDFSAIGLWCGDSLFALLSVVKELCHEKVADLVWHGSLNGSALHFGCAASDTYIWIIC